MSLSIITPFSRYFAIPSVPINERMPINNTTSFNFVVVKKTAVRAAKAIKLIPTRSNAIARSGFVGPIKIRYKSKKNDIDIPMKDMKTVICSNCSVYCRIFIICLPPESLFHMYFLYREWTHLLYQYPLHEYIILSDHLIQRLLTYQALKKLNLL